MAEGRFLNKEVNASTSIRNWLEWSCDTMLEFGIKVQTYLEINIDINDCV